MGKKTPKKQGVGVEFKKVKHKVGKKLPKAANETKVDFKSRAINLPNQSITADKDEGATSRRNLTVKELLSQAGHHNAKVRKEAIQELGELLVKCPAEAHKHTGLIIETLAERVSDADEAIRTAFSEMLKEKFLSLLSPAAISPFLPVLMAHLCSAMTHLSTDVRLDALNFLHALMEAVPELLSRGFLVPCLQHLQDLLSQLHRARSLKAQSLPALHKVVSGMSFFLQRAFNKAASSSKDSGAKGQSSHTSVPAQSASVLGASTGLEWAPLAADRCTRSPETAASLLNKLLTSLSGGEPSKQESSAADGVKTALSQTHTQAATDPAVKRAAIQLLCALFDCWSEATPAQLASAPELEPVQVLVQILRCANILMEHLPLMDEAADREKLRKAIWSRVHPFFPAPAPAVKPSQVLHDALVQFNLESAQLLIRFTPKDSFAAHGDEPWVQRLVGFYCGVLQQGQVLPVQADSLGASTTSAGRPAHSTAAAVLSAIPLLLSSISPPGQATLLAAVHHLSCAVPITSPTQSACIRLQQDLLAGTLRAGGTLLDPDQLASWLEPLPKMLWELGTRQPDTTLAALQLLHEAARCASPNSPLAASLSSISPQLAPLFCIRLPSKPALSQSQSKLSSSPSHHDAPVTILMGPLTRLPPQHQTAAIDVLPSLPSLSPELLKSLALTLSTTCFPEPIILRLAALLTSHSLSIPFHTWATILGSILTSPLTRFQSKEGASLDLPGSRFDRLVNTIAVHWNAGQAALLGTLAVVEEKLIEGFDSSWEQVQVCRWQAEERVWSNCRTVSYGVLKLFGSCPPSASSDNIPYPQLLEKKLMYFVVGHEVAARVLHILSSKAGDNVPQDESTVPSSNLTQEQAHVALTLLKSSLFEVNFSILNVRPDVAVSCIQLIVKIMHDWSETFKLSPSSNLADDNHNTTAANGQGNNKLTSQASNLQTRILPGSSSRIAGWGLVCTACALARAGMKVNRRDKDKSQVVWVNEVSGSLKLVVSAVEKLYNELTDGGQLYVTGQAEVHHLKFLVKDWVDRGSRAVGVA